MKHRIARTCWGLVLALSLLLPASAATPVTSRRQIYDVVPVNLRARLQFRFAQYKRFLVQRDDNEYVLLLEPCARDTFYSSMAGWRERDPSYAIDYWTSTILSIKTTEVRSIEGKTTEFQISNVVLMQSPYRRDGESYTNCGAVCAVYRDSDWYFSLITVFDIKEVFD